MQPLTALLRFKNAVPAPGIVLAKMLSEQP